MKSILFSFLFMGFFDCTICRAAFYSKPDTIIISDLLKETKLSEVVHLSAYDFYKVSGRKPSLKEQLAFALAKMDMKKANTRHPGITVGQYLTERKQPTIGDILLKILGAFLIIFLLTLLLGPTIRL